MCNFLHQSAWCFRFQQRQAIVDILLQIMIEGSGYTPKQAGMLYTFLARQIARHSNSIRLNKGLFEQVSKLRTGLDLSLVGVLTHSH